MTEEYTHTDLATRLTHFRRVVIKKNHYLAYTVEGLKQADPQFRWLDANKNPRSKLRGFSMSFRAQRGILSKIPHYVRDDNKRSKLRGERSEGSKPEEIEQNADLTERLDAFVSRFCRLQDTLGDKLLPIYLRMQLEPIGTVLDNLNRAERLGLIPSVADGNKNPRSKLWGISMSFRAQRGILSKIPHYVRDDNKRSELRGERSEGSKPEEIEARTLRNNLVHEYTEDVDVLRQSILRALELIPMLETVTNKLCQESRKQL